MNKAKIAILSDFDGTISPMVVLDSLYFRFGSPACREINRSWERGDISTPDEIRGCFATMSTSQMELEAFLDTVPIDPAFPQAYEYFRKIGYPFAIVSDGLRWYIDYILHRFGIEGMCIYANEIQFEPGGYQFSFPWYDDHTPKRGTGKRAIVQNYQKDGFRVVFIGDGLTDTDAALTADLVYARAGLADFTRVNNIPAIEFSDYSDLLSKWQAS